ncbi:uncharacterized protein G2W53_024108 [Senna tora]|uniref:Uncharacterized protein n=1 Tax=Senna tora TaxID=362788 RepID=A0A834TAN7_9FABA|nr:uncharacterized protein G2W53_024108 [Senna tora]
MAGPRIEKLKRLGQEKRRWMKVM